MKTDKIKDDNKVNPKTINAHYRNMARWEHLAAKNLNGRRRLI